MAGTRISTRPKKPTEKAAASAQPRITKTRTRAPRSKPSPKKSKKRKLAVSSDDDLVDDSDDSIVAAARTLEKKAASKSNRARRKSKSIEVVELEDGTTDDEEVEEPDVIDRGGPGTSTVDGEDVSQFVLHFLGSVY